ncbi:MAG: PilZ domain-containing protein [Magnetococcales bacterium]|nr:PilZ domain-containing protein [Magnetococcales bacterium]
MINSAEFKDNAIFIHYGKSVSQCFNPGLEVSDHINFFPTHIKGIHNAQNDPTTHNSTLFKFAEPNLIQKFTKNTRQLRADLLNENGKISDQPNSGTALKLKEFRNGLAKGSEAMLDENPFFELTALLYQINMTAMERMLISEQHGWEEKIPQPIKSSRSLSHIWGREGSLISSEQKLIETLRKIASIGKISFGLLLFVGSTLTTAEGVTDVVQSTFFTELFGSAFVGESHESARILLSLIIGVTLSSVILDFKSRLFQGVAETGQVFKGFWNAFKRFPRWITLSLFLTSISIWTNYDGIVLLMSKTQDLTYQLEKIEQQVNQALGEADQIDTDNPDSLFDLKATLKKKSELAIQQFKQVPEDEESGSASSGVASKGPRYWAKHFIVNGGYKPGQHDVVNAYRNTAFIRRVDNILARSNLDLSTSLEDQINTITQAYDAHFNTTRDLVQKNLSTLSDQISLNSYSPEEFSTLLKLEAYHINNQVQTVVKLLEDNKEAFAKAAQEINQLASEYIALLTKIDKIGTPANNAYVIDINFKIPEVDAIEHLKQGMITQAKRRSLGELKKLLLERHGTLLGGSALFIILFFAVFMDLSDPILYSAMVARWGRRDRHFLNENMKRFIDWEEKYVAHLRSFFVRPEISPLIPKTTCPGNLVFRNSYNLFLEDIFPKCKDRESRTCFENSRFWFQSLFLNTRMQHVGEYNNRQFAVRKLIREREKFIPKLIVYIFPGIKNRFIPGRDNFDRIHNSLTKSLLEAERDFFDRLDRYRHELSQPSDTNLEKQAAQTGPSTQSPSDIQKLFGVLKTYYEILFKKPLTKPVEPCPIMRVSWTKSIALSHTNSDLQINGLAKFTALLERWLTVDRFPKIHSEILTPLQHLLDKIPNREMLIRALELETELEKHENLKENLKVVLGLSTFYGFQLDENILAKIIGSSGIEQVSNLFLKPTQENHDQDVANLEKLIDQQEHRLERSYGLIKILVEEQDAIVFILTKIRRNYISPINSILSHLQNRTLIAESLGFDQLTHKVTTCEQFIMQLWNAPTSALENQEMEQTDQIEQIESNPIIAYFFCRNRKSNLTLLGEIKMLEVMLKSTLEQLNATVFTLTFLDKLSGKVISQLKETNELAEELLFLDKKIRHIQTDDPRIDQDKINFLDDSRLFLRSMPTQLKTLQSKINLILKSPTLGEPQSVELFRKMENQIFKLYTFSKNAVDYLNDQRDGLGLAAALAQIEPQIHDMQSFTQTRTSLSVQEAQKNCQLIKEYLEQVSLKEWDLLKQSIPPQKPLKILIDNRDWIDQTWLAVEHMSYSVDTMPPTSDSNNEESLHFINRQAETLLKKLEAILEELSMPFYSDRRLTKKETVEESAKRRQNEIEKKMCDSYLPDSRRKHERVHVLSSVELLSAIGSEVIHGEILDVSTNGICMKTNHQPIQLQEQMEIGFNFSGKPKENAFKCRIVRLSGNMIILNLLAGEEAKFTKNLRPFLTPSRSERLSETPIKFPTVP